MDYCVIETRDGKQCKIDLPLDITLVPFSYAYFDDELKEQRETHPDHWVVDRNDNTPKRFKVQVKEFRKICTAVNYARAIYVRYLKDEVRRVKGCDNDM